VPVRDVFLSFCWSGLLSVPLFVVLGSQEIIQSVTTLGRLTPFNFHPNLLAYLHAGYFAALTWKFMTCGWRGKVFTGLVAFACLFIIFFASSRGSLVALAVGCGFILSLAALRQIRNRTMTMSHPFIWAGTVVVVIGIASPQLKYVENAYGFVDDVLQLSNSERGIGSGLTGRTAMWTETMKVFSDGSWITGHGVRSADAWAATREASIDNSYLVILYDLGLVSILLITGRFVYILFTLVKSYLRAIQDGQRMLYLGMTLVMVVFLVNNIVERDMFAVGNPFSLFAMLLFITPSPRLRLNALQTESHLQPRLWSAKVD
jgi:O-antigen ligase